MVRLTKSQRMVVMTALFSLPCLASRRYANVDFTFRIPHKPNQEFLNSLRASPTSRNNHSLLYSNTTHQYPQDGSYYSCSDQGYVIQPVVYIPSDFEMDQRP